MSFCLQIPKILSSRLRLRLLDRADAPEFHAMSNEPAILKAIDFLPDPFTVDDATKLLTGDPEFRFFGVWLREESSMLGNVGAKRHTIDRIEIGYWFSERHHGKGFAIESVQAFVAALREEYPAASIFAECMASNEPSTRLLERAGFRFQGEMGDRPDRKRLELQTA